VIKRANIRVNGIVQGVGFRPFIYRIAKKYSLVGSVMNMGDAGVRIVVEGEEELIKEFLDTLRAHPPSISRIDKTDVVWDKPHYDCKDFRIEKSSNVRTSGTDLMLPPDIAVCNDCVEDLFSPESRWYMYPFTSCAACGPRFSTIIDIPYDRPYTTMSEFPLCSTCNTGYTNPLDRRYHAQTTACAQCGPAYQLTNAKGVALSEVDPIKETARLLGEDKIVAIQGISGTHLVTATSRTESIRELRERKHRFQRPFAIMARNSETLERNFSMLPEERNLISSWRRPIVLLQKKVNHDKQHLGQNIPAESLELISPSLDTVGVMLPYAPMHHLLFHYSEEAALVMTSANPSGVPMYIDPATILTSLNEIADYFLLHNRRIYQRTDDSVVKFVTKNNPVFIRRARGYAPEPISVRNLTQDVTILAVGPEEKATAAILKSGKVYPTQYIGDITNVESLEFLKAAYRHLSHLIGVETPDAIACDLHPEFLSTIHAEEISKETGVSLYRVQHHHAHLSSLLAEHLLPLDTRIVCITADGYGYGIDGSAWGGEILVGNSLDFENRAGLMSYEYPGGDLSAVYAVRPLVSMLRHRLTEDNILKIGQDLPVSQDTSLSEKVLSALFRILDTHTNTIQSSSVGRYLDAVAAMLGICSSNTYDGECPMKLEAVAKKSSVTLDYSFESQENRTVIDGAAMLEQIINLKRDRLNISELAYVAQWQLGKALAQLAIDVAQREGIKQVGFSGGVALNRILTKAIVESITSAGLLPLIHAKVPPGDGGVSIGQTTVAAANFLHQP
jgi:hydrogenase maturation protein HypF